MEQKRMFLAMALSFTVIMVWVYFFGDLQKGQVPAEQKGVQTQQDHQPQTDSGQESRQKAVIDTDDEQKQSAISSGDTIKTETKTPESAYTPRVITVDTPLYSVKISEKGAVFKSFILKDYTETIMEDSPLKELISSENKEGTVQAESSDSSLKDMANTVFYSDSATEDVQVEESREEIRFSWTSPSGIVVEKKYSFIPDTYMIGYEIIVKNGSDKKLDNDLKLSLLKIKSEKKRTIGFEGSNAFIDNRIEEIKIKENETKEFEGNIKWVAVQDRYFISSIIPQNVIPSEVSVTKDQNHRLKTQYIQPAATIDPGNERRYEFNLYFGPKSVSVLKGLNCDLDKAIDFYGLDALAKPALILMKMLYRVIPNYGVNIIILTLLIKIVLWPLGTKSYKSMNEMKKLQPLMAELREKYKDDKKRMNEETMGLYKTYKINPLGGCLPMVAQIPIFIAFYGMLYGAVELRHAPFFGWITDLSAPDRLFDFAISIPFMQPPYGIPVLTIIMGATMLIQQKMSPPPGDPAQAKMMMLMPVVFTVIFVNFSSGLVLYWLVNNVLSIAQQYYIAKKYG